MTEPEKSHLPFSDNKAYRAGIFKLLGRIIIYYACLGGVLGLLALLFPTIREFIPVGGISQYTGSGGGFGPVLSSSDIAQTLPPANWLETSIELFLAMLSSLLLMLPVSWVYTTIHEGQEFDHSIDETTLVLPAVVAGVVAVVQHSLALAFSLAGIVAGVRFRRALTDTFDTLFIFVAIGVGIAAGVGSIEIAAVITVFFNFSTLIIMVFGDGLESRYVAQKKADKQLLKLKAQSQIEPAPEKPVSTDSGPNIKPQ